MITKVRHKLNRWLEHWEASRLQVPEMVYTPLGRTGLSVSVAGLGGGGYSRLGLKTGHSSLEAVRLVQAAFDLGINLFDTSEAYKTETILGQALHQYRSQVVLSTKKVIISHDQSVMINPQEMAQSLEQSLKNLKTDYIDIYHLHGVTLPVYEQALNEYVPELVKLKAAGKIRFLGLTESFSRDPAHQMLAKALHDDWADVVLVGFNLLNPSARQAVFPLTQARNVGVLGAFAVRRSLQSFENLNVTVDQLKQNQFVEPTLTPKPLEDFVQSTGSSLPDVAYRYCRSEASIDSVLIGTGQLKHLKLNVRSILSAPLPANLLDYLSSAFGHVSHFSDD